MEQVFLKVLNMSITAGYCTLAVLVLRLLLKKFPKVYSYALWSIVAFRLLCPVSFESVFSLVRISPDAVPPDIALQQTPQISTGLGSIDMVVNKALAVAAPTTALTDTSPLNGPDSANLLQIILFFGSLIWILIAIFLFSYSIITYILIRQKLKGARQEAPGIYVSDRLKTPFVLGLFRPSIYLPEGLTGSERAYVLLHEQTHIRRYDHLIKMAAFVLVCLHWFNPLLWLSYFLMCADMEMSCDEAVIRTLAGEHTAKTKKEYASTLLGLASHHPVSFGGPLAFGEGNIKQRITNVLTYKKRTVAVSAILVIAVAAAILLLAGNQKEPSENQPKITETPKGTSDMTSLGEDASAGAATNEEGNPPPDTSADEEDIAMRQENAEDILVYIKEIDLESQLVTFDALEWVVVPSERADELGYTLDDAPNGYVIINDTVERNSLPLAEHCTFHLLDWEHNYQNTTVTRSEFFHTLTERRLLFDSTDYPAYNLLIEGGEILDIQEQYEP